MADFVHQFLFNPPLDYNWVTDRLAVGGAIWTRKNMQALAAAGLTHVVSMQSEFDDSPIADGTGVCVLWNPCEDDLEEKPLELFERGVGFAVEAYRADRSRIYFHCSMGVHRGPMMLLAFLGATGIALDEGIEMIRRRHPIAEFPDVYRESVARFLKTWGSARSKEA